LQRFNICCSSICQDSSYSLTHSTSARLPRPHILYTPHIYIFSHIYRIYLYNLPWRTHSATLANNFRSIAEGKYGESGRERGIEAARSDFPYAAAPAPPFGFWTLWLKTTSTQKLSSGTAARDPRTQIWEELGVGGASWLWLFVFYLGPPTARQKFFICLLISVLILVLANCETKRKQARAAAVTLHILSHFDLPEIRSRHLDSSQLVPRTFCRFFLSCVCVYFMFVLARYTSVPFRIPLSAAPGSRKFAFFCQPTPNISPA